MTKKKLICVVGATGNQGGSVARRFLQDSRFEVRGLTRDKTSQASQELAALGVEMVDVNLDDVETIKIAFKAASVIFGVTQFWEPFLRPDCRAKAKELGITYGRYAYNIEYQQGRNIADAAATTVETLDENGFLVATLSHARKCSNGAYTELYHFDAKADVFPDYVLDKYPALAAKMSCIHAGYFTTSHDILPKSYFQKQSDGMIEMHFTTAPDRSVPHIDVNADTGNFVYAVHQMPPGKAYMAAGTFCSWPEFIRLWGQATGKPTRYKQVSVDEMIADQVDVDVGVEAAYMFSYSNEPGYDGGMDLLTAEDLRKVGIDCPMTSLEDYIARTDWSPVLARLK